MKKEHSSGVKYIAFDKNQDELIAIGSADTIKKAVTEHIEQMAKDSVDSPDDLEEDINEIIIAQIISSPIDVDFGPPKIDSVKFRGI